MPITREEKLLNTLATGVASGVSPITREEQYLSYIAGETYTKPDSPITRKEAFLDKIPQGGGGGGGVTIKNQNKTITENGTYTADSGYTGLGTVTVDVQASGGTGEGEETVTDFARYIEGSLENITAKMLTGAAEVYDYSFYYNDIIKSVQLPNTITKIGKTAFYNCKALVSIVLDSVTKIGENAFYGCTGLNSINLGVDLETIGSNAFYRCTELTVVTIPENVTNIGTDAFGKLSKLVEINFNARNVASSNVVFSDGCGDSGWGITLNIGAEVTKLPKSFMYSNAGSSPNITRVVFAEGCVCSSIGEKAFKGCKSLESITIPESVTTMGTNFLKGCTSLSTVTMKPTTPPSLGTNAIDTTALIQIIVPAGCGDAYKAATNWSAYADIIVEEGATE